MKPEKLGPFQIGRVLGRGGMGAVYEGTYELDGSTVAVKVLSGAFEGDEDTEVRLRFETEIETLKRLYHPNIVRLSGFGENQGQLYYVMDLIDGSSLQQELRKKRLFQWEEVAKIGLDICQALRHAHDRGIIHRDIKPANILLDQEGNVKLSDFGIARFFGSQQITDVHTVIGTLEYMAPEQALANPINSSADLYSLGCVLYALLTGKPPFTARSLSEMLNKHKNSTPVPIQSVRLDVPDDLGYLISDLLQIQPDHRPRNALLVAKRLQSLLQALIGPPENIKVFPMSPETLNWHHESAPLPAGSGFHPDLYSPQSQKDLEHAISLGEVVKPERKTAVQTPQHESLADSFKRIGEEHSTDSKESERLGATDSPTVTALSSSIWESPPDDSSVQPSQSDQAATVPPPAALRHSEVLLPDTHTLHPAKDEPLPDAIYRLESSIITPNDAVPKEKLSEYLGAPAAGRESDSTSHRQSTTSKLMSQDRFIAVESKNLDPFEEEHRSSHPIISLPMALTSTMLMIVGLVVYYLLQPPSPEVLFERITTAIGEDDTSGEISPTLLRSAQNDIKQFLVLYSNHPEADQVRYYQDELDLLEHERRLERRTQVSTLHSLNPVERAYIEVLTSTPSNSEQMVDKLRAFIAVFRSTEPAPKAPTKSHRSVANPVDVCVELAQRRLKKLEQIVAEINTEQEEVIRRRLDEAATLDTIDPSRADDIRRGIIELYQNHRWANELVEEAKQQLEGKGDRR